MRDLLIAFPLLIFFCNLTTYKNPPIKHFWHICCINYLGFICKNIRIGGFVSKKYDNKDNGFHIFIKALVWGFLIFVLFLIFLTLLQCTIKKPSSPTWNTKLKIPLISRTYDMRKIVEELGEPSLILDSLGNPYFYKKIEMDTIRAEELLTLDSTEKSFSDTLGVFNITPPDTKETEFFLSEIYGGQLGLIPPFTFLLEEELQKIENFTFVAMDQGEAFIMVSNHLGLDLDSLSIDLVDEENSQIIATIVYPEMILNDSSMIQQVDLSEKYFSNNLSFDIKAHTPGGTILTLADKYLSLSLSFSDSIYVKEAIAQVPEISRGESQKLYLPKEHSIQSGEIDRGNVVFSICNRTALGGSLQITLPHLTNYGNPLYVTRNLSPFSSDQVEVLLDGYQVGSVTEGEFDLNWVFESPGTGGEQVEVKSSDSIQVQVKFDQMKFREISGVFSPTEVEIHRGPEPLNLPDGFESAKLSGAYLKAEILNGVSLPAILSVRLIGDQGQQLEIDENIFSGNPYAPVSTLIQKDDLDDFFDPVPYEITVSGRALYGDGQNSATITRDDFVLGKVEIFSPIEAIFDSNDVELDTDSDSLEEENRKLLNQRVNWANLVISLENHLPLGLSVELLFKDSEDVYNQPDLIIGPLRVNSGQRDQNGIVINTSYLNENIELDKQDLEIFEERPFWIGGYIHLEGTNGEKIKVVPEDFVKITSYVEAEIKMGEIK